MFFVAESHLHLPELGEFQRASGSMSRMALNLKAVLVGGITLARQLRAPFLIYSWTRRPALFAFFAQGEMEFMGQGIRELFSLQ